METREISTEEKTLKKVRPTLRDFVGQHKTVTICIFATLFLSLIVTVTILTIRMVEARDIQKAQIGKCYMETYSNDWDRDYTYTVIHCFKENGVARLEIRYNKDDKVNYISGSLDAINFDYSFKVSLFGTPYLNYTYSKTPVVLDENNQIIQYIRPWKAISMEEALAFEKESRCEHQFGKTEVIEEATCSSVGEEKRVCQICGYEKTTTTAKLEHNYVNKICSVCGSKKTAEKSNINSNTWYTYDGGPLCVQNCLVKSAISVSQGKGMMVQYHAVCRHCHAIDESSKLAGPEVNYEVKKVYYCNECGGQTLVRLKID